LFTLILDFVILFGDLFLSYLYFIVPPPELQPIPDQTVTQGLNVTFTCIAKVGFHLSYIWTIPHLSCVDCGPVSLNIPTITLTNVTNEANGLYTCRVNDFVNQIITASAVLNIAGTGKIYSFML